MNKLYENLSKEEKKKAIRVLNERMEALDTKLKKQPTELERRWFDFATRNTGYEFLEIETGEVYSKLAFFQVHKHDKKSLNLVSENLLNGWIRRLKADWTMDKSGLILEPVLKEFQTVYKKKEE